FCRAKRDLLITWDFRNGRIRRCGSHCLADLADKAEALSCNSANPALLFTIIPNCAPGGVDSNRDRRIRYDPTAPGRRQEFIPADNMVAITNKELQQIEHFWLDRDQH